MAEVRERRCGDSAHAPGRTAAERPGSDSPLGATRGCRGCARGCAGLLLSGPHPRSKPHESLDFRANAGLRGSESRISDTPTRPHDTPTRAVPSLPLARPRSALSHPRTPATRRKPHESLDFPRGSGPQSSHPRIPALRPAHTRDAPDGTRSAERNKVSRPPSLLVLTLVPHPQPMASSCRRWQ